MPFDWIIRKNYLKVTFCIIFFIFFYLDNIEKEPIVLKREILLFTSQKSLS